MKQIIVTKELATLGLRVVAGRDWAPYEQQDMMTEHRTVTVDRSKIGTIVKISAAGDNWIRVKWDSGYEDNYPVGGSSGYALYVYSPINQDVVGSGVMVTQENARVGLKVRRGKDWSWNAQDGKEGNWGTITSISKNNGSWPFIGWVLVKWNGAEALDYGYRIGADGGKYDLYMYAPSELVERMEREEKVNKARRLLEGSIVQERYYDILQSLKPNTNDRHTEYSGNCLYLPSKNLTLQRGERPEGRRLQG